MNNQPIIRIMLDLETMSLEDNAAIVQIGACTMDGVDKFLISISPDNASKYGHVDPGTMQWWDKQDAQIRASVFGGDSLLPEALILFTQWLYSQSQGSLQNLRIYSKGQSDHTWLRNAYYKVQGSYPIHYRSPCDMRTLKDVCDFLGMPALSEAVGKPVNAHNALSDAIGQAEEVRARIRQLENMMVF